MSLTLKQVDITTLNTDAIVNAANSRLAPGGGVCGAIFRSAGYDKLDRACRAIGGCPTGSAAITPGFDLPAKYVIHAVGPIWQGGRAGEEEQLREAYRSALTLAVDNGCTSIAFPLISSGIYGYPKRQAMEIALTTILDFQKEHPIDVVLALFGGDLLALGQEMLEGLC